MQLEKKHGVIHLSAHIPKLMCRLIHPRLGNHVTMLSKSGCYRPQSVLGNAMYPLDYVNFISHSFISKEE